MITAQSVVNAKTVVLALYAGPVHTSRTYTSYVVFALRPGKLIGDAVPVTIVPPVPGVAAVPGVKPVDPYSTIKLLPAEVKLTEADVDVIDPTEIEVGVLQVCP